MDRREMMQLTSCKQSGTLEFIYGFKREIRLVHVAEAHATG
jgi:hypothetical protein